METKTLIEMLRFRRAPGTKSIRAFEKRFLFPIFGKPDIAGNYSLDVGQYPNVIFAAHFDSVHYTGGMQRIEIIGDCVTLAPSEMKSNCLGADCATGIWLILEMISAGISGRYIVHAEEERGCIGARWIVKNRPEMLKGIDAVISLDRKGTGDIITHQSPGRTCSDDFADSLALILGLPMKASDRGSYTDSVEYADDISECTNLSVGYYSQHTEKESQDLSFAESLRIALIQADWRGLRFSRSPGDFDMPTRKSIWAGFDDNYMTKDSEMAMDEMVSSYPDLVADILESLGYTKEDLARDIAETYFQPQLKRGFN